MYDTTYSTPNGSIVLEDNKFDSSKFKYIFHGTNINIGKDNLVDKNNYISAGELLSSKYINNSHFAIK